MTQILTLMRYGPQWRESRKFAHLALNADAVKQYEHSQQEHVVSLLRSLIHDPATFNQQIRLYV
jgi:cytochrome P450